MPRILLLAGIIILAALFSLSERVFEAVRTSLLRERAARGDRGAAWALKLDARSHEVLPALRFGAIISTILAGVIAGLGLLDAEHAAGLDTPWWSAGRAGVAVVLIVILLFSESLARRIAPHDPERTASQLAGFIAAWSAAASPVVRALGWFSEWAARVIPIRPVARPRINHEEVISLLADRNDDGGFEPAEVEIIKRVFRFCDRRARTMMTPRDEVVWIDLADSPEEVRRKVVGTPHSRFPVCDQSLDNLLGIVQVKDLLAQRSEGPMFRVKGNLTLPAFIFEGTRGPQLVEILRGSSTQIAVVLDEYGSVVGLLTLNDILQTVLGNLPEGRSEAEEDRVVLRPDGSRLIDGRLPIDEFRDLYGLATLPEGDFHTVAGLVVSQLGHIPRTSDSLVLQGLRFEVVKMHANRVVQVLVSSLNGRPESP